MSGIQQGRIRQPIKAEYQFKSTMFIGPHATQIAVDVDGEYAVHSTSTPARLAQKLREIADHIEQDQQDTA